MEKKMIFILLTILTFVFASCTKNKETQIEEVDEKIIPTVKTEIIEQSTLYETCSTNGNVRVAKSVEVFPVVTGRVVSFPVKMGQKIYKGDVLAVIDPSINGSNYSLHKITSPIDGNLLSIPVQNGTVASPENKIAVVGDLSELQIIAYIPERFYSLLKPGLKADISVETYPDECFAATVKEVSPVIDEDSRTTEIILTLNSKTKRICAGMFADITLYLKAYENVLSIPSSCVSERSGNKYVYKNENGYSKLVHITTGLTFNNRTIVLEGINSGDFVITEGYETLTDNEEINVITN